MCICTNVRVIFPRCRVLVGRTRNPKCIVDRSFSHAVRRVDRNLTATSPLLHCNRSVRLLLSGTVQCIIKYKFTQSSFLWHVLILQVLFAHLYNKVRQDYLWQISLIKSWHATVAFQQGVTFQEKMCQYKLAYSVHSA